MNFRYVLAVLVCALMSQGVANPAPMVIRFSHVTSDLTPKGQAAIKFKELAEKRLPGRVQVHVYPNSQLFGDDKEMQALQLGDVHVIAPSLAKFGAYTRQLQVFDLPFLFQDMAAVERFQASATGQRLLTSMGARGIHGFGYLHNGMKQLSANTPLRLPADARGLRFRIQPSDVLIAQFQAIGAKPQKMAFADVYPALRSGLVDGAENPWSNIVSQNFHTVQKYITETNHGALEYLVIGNATWWNSLPADIRQGLSEAMTEAIRYGNQVALKEEAAYRNQVLAANQARVLTLNAQQLQAWRKAMQPVWQAFENDIGKEVMEAASDWGKP